MNELTKFLIKELLDEQKTVAIYGGGFKPPTKGHFTVAKQTLEQFPEIDELKIFVGGGVRDGITQDESIQVWNIYKNYLSDKVSVEPSVAPVKSILGYAKENPDTKVYWVLGARDGEESDLEDIASRTKSISKYPNLEVKVITSTGGVSGTKTRQSLKANNKEQFFQLIPNIKEKEQIWNIVQPAVKEEITPDQIKQADAFADKQLAPVDIDLTSKHVFDRLTGRDSDVTLAQLIGFFKRLGRNKKEFFDFFKKYKEIVVNDKTTNLNIPFLNMTNKAIAKTIMRKDNFLSSSPKLVFEVGEMNTPQYLYHATYKPLLKKIKEKGLDTNDSKKAWDDSVSGYVYLALDPYVAESYAEESEMVPESWLDNIIILKVDTSKLDKSKLFIDQNVQNNEGDTLEYRGTIPWEALSLQTLNEVGEANLKPYKWKEVYANGPFIFVEFITDSETEYKVDLTEFNYIDNDLNNYDALAIEFRAKPKGAEGGSAKIVVNKGELYKVMSTITAIIKHYVKKFESQAITYSPSKKSSEENFGTQRDNLYKAFISKAIPGVRFEQSGDDITAILPNKETLNEVGEANLKPYKWEEIDRESYYVYIHFVTDSETQYDVDIKSTTYYPPGQMDSVPALEIEFLAKPKDAQGSSAKVVVNKGELYRVMATLADIIKKYLKKSKAQAIIYSPSKKSSEENFGIQRDNLYRAFISKALPGTTFKQSGDYITAILPNNMINEGRYDSITRLVVKDIMDSWKNQFDSKEGELRFEEDYELENSKGQPIDFELLAILKLEETEDKTYIVDGGANEELDPPYLEVTFQVDPRNLPKMWSTIYNDLIDVVRHEIEHLTQAGTNVISSKEMADDQSIRQMINWGLLPQAEYFKLEKEVDAMLQGMYLKAKKSKTPFKDIINDYFEKVGLEGEDKQDVLNLWTKRLKALNLPPIKEASNPQAGTALPYGSGFAPVKENDLFGLNKLVETFVKEAFEEDWNLQDGMLSLTKYMMDNGMNIKPLPKIKVIKDDKENASNLLGKTAYYNPADKSITLFTMNRHPKDVLRSFSHEMVHHMQNLEGRLNNINTTNTNEDGDLPEIEREAYEKGNMMLRNWEDNIKNV